MKNKKTFALKYNIGKNIYFRCYNCSEKLEGNEEVCPGCDSPIEAIPIFTQSKKSVETVDEEKELIKKIKSQKISLEIEQIPEISKTSSKKRRKLIRTAISILTSIAIIIGSIITIPYLFDFDILSLLRSSILSSSEETVNAGELQIYPQTKEFYGDYIDNYTNTNNITNHEYLANLDFYQLELHLHDFMSQFGDTVSIYFENFETDFVFHYNPYEVYFASNIAALPFAYYIWQKSSDALNSIRETITFEERDRWAGTGIIQNLYETGTELTQKRLLETMIQHSDNIAIMMLRRYHGVNSYTAFIESIGANASFINTITYSEIDAFNAGLFTKVIFEFLEAGYYYSSYFREDLLNHNHSFVNFTYPAASKTAWAPDAMHEIAIVYAPSPFSLSILSSKVGNSEDRRIFTEIATYFESFNEIFYGG